MKKNLQLLFIFMTALLSFTFTSCGDDEDGLSGIYVSSTTNQGYVAAYYFKDSNTVVFYSSAHNGPTTGVNGLVACKVQIGSTNWYGMDNGTTYTYAISDNKVYVTNGTIFTISGDTLIPDGSKVTYTKSH